MAKKSSFSKTEKPAPKKVSKPSAAASSKQLLKKQAKTLVSDLLSSTSNAASPPPEEGRKHARLGPSQFKSREICPSYKPTQGESKAAKIGTKLHGLMEEFGVDVNRSPEFAELDCGSQISMLEMVAEYVRPFELRATSKSNIHREVELDLTSYNIPDCEFGTADLVIEWDPTESKQLPTHADLFDYKFGWIEVDDPEINSQGWLYALGVFVKFPHIKTVTVHLLQPARDEIGTHTFSRQDITRMLARALAIAHRVQKLAGKEFNPIASNCIWCANKGHCKPFHEMALVVVDKAPIVIDDELASMLSPDNLQGDDLLIYKGSALYDLAKQMEGWADAIKRRIIALAEDGWEIAGKKMKHVSGKTSITDPEGVVSLIAQDFDKPMDEVIASICDVSIGKVDSYVASMTEKGGKDAAKSGFRQKILGEGMVYIGAPTKYLIDDGSKTQD
jgi:hypothetical protein